MIADAVARVMPILVFALFGKVLMASSVRVALTEALKNADVFVTGMFGASGWLLSSYLDKVDKRFDDVDKRFDDVKTQFQTLTDLLMPRRAAK